MKSLVKAPGFWIGALLALFFVCMGAGAEIWMPHDPLETDIYHVLEGPDAEYPLGRDELGRCVLSRLIAGARTTLGAALLVGFCASLLGLLIGMLAGYYTRVFDPFASLLMDILLAFPSLILALVIAGLIGQGMGNLVLAMVAVYWVEPARIARSMTRALTEKAYIQAARAAGSGGPAILLRHILPGILPGVLAQISLQMASILLGISALSFIGLGVQPPYAEWGAMLNEARANMRTHPHIMIAVMACLMLCVAAFQFLGEALRDALTPRRSHLAPWRGQNRLSAP